MGYVSLSEDLVNRFYDMRAMIDKSTSEHTQETQKIVKEKLQFSEEEIDDMYESLKFVRRQLKDSRSKLNETEHKNRNANDEIQKMQQFVKIVRKQNNDFKAKINKNETLLKQLRREITSILEKNELSRKMAESRSHEILLDTVNNVNRENADIILDLKAGIAQIESIIHQQNFHKKADNINSIKLVLKKLINL